MQREFQEYRDGMKLFSVSSIADFYIRLIHVYCCNNFQSALAVFYTNIESSWHKYQPKAEAFSYRFSVHLLYISLHYSRLEPSDSKQWISLFLLYGDADLYKISIYSYKELAVPYYAATIVCIMDVQCLS